MYGNEPEKIVVDNNALSDLSTFFQNIKENGILYEGCKAQLTLNCPLTNEQLTKISNSFNSYKANYQIVLGEDFSCTDLDSSENKEFTKLLKSSTSLNIQCKIDLSKLLEKSLDKKSNISSLSINSNISASDISKITDKIESLTLNFTEQPIDKKEVCDQLINLAKMSKQGNKDKEKKGLYSFTTNLALSEQEATEFFINLIKLETRISIYLPEADQKVQELLRLHNIANFISDKSEISLTEFKAKGNLSTFISLFSKGKPAIESIKLINAVDGNASNISISHITELFEGLKEATNITNITFERIKLTHENVETFFQKLGEVKHITKINFNAGILDGLQQDKITALADYVKQATNLEELTVNSGADHLDKIIPAIIEAGKGNPKLRLKVEGQVKDKGLQAQIEEFNNRKQVKTAEPITPAAPRNDNPQTIKTDTTAPAPTTPAGDAPKASGTDKNSPAPITLGKDELAKIDNFVNNLLCIGEPKQQAQGKFSHRIRTEEKEGIEHVKEKISNYLTDKILNGMKHNPAFKSNMEQILQSDETQNNAISTIIRSLNNLEVEGAKFELKGAKLYNVGRENGASFANSLASFFYSLVQSLFDKGQSLKDWANNNPILVIKNYEHFNVSLGNAVSEKSMNVSALDAFIDKAAKACGVDKSQGQSK